VVGNTVQNGLAGSPCIADAPRRGSMQQPHNTRALHSKYKNTHTLHALINRLSAIIHSGETVNVHNGKENRHAFIKPVYLRESV